MIKKTTPINTKVFLGFLKSKNDINTQQIFSCLKPNIDTVPKLKNELITTIGLNVNIVNNIFNDYGY